MVASGEDEGNCSLDRKGDGSMVGGGSLDESTCEVKDETDGRAEVAGEGRTALCFLLFALLPRPCPGKSLAASGGSAAAGTDAGAASALDAPAGAALACSAAC